MSDKQEAKAGTPINRDESSETQIAPETSKNASLTETVSEQASFSRDQLMLSVYPPLEYLDCLQRNDPVFYREITDDYIQGRKHDRNIELRGQNIFIIIAILAFGTIFYSIHKNFPWTAIIIFGLAALVLATAFLFLSRGGRSIHLSARRERGEVAEEHKRDIEE